MFIAFFFSRTPCLYKWTRGYAEAWLLRAIPTSEKGRPPASRISRKSKDSSEGVRDPTSKHPYRAQEARPLFAFSLPSRRSNGVGAHEPPSQEPQHPNFATPFSGSLTHRETARTDTNEPCPRAQTQKGCHGKLNGGEKEANAGIESGLARASEA